MAQEQTRWGQRNQQISYSAPDVTPHQQPQGWQQQSKWRRKTTQQQSTGPGWTNVDFTGATAQVNVNALAPQIVLGGYPWQQQSKWRRKVQQNVSLTPPPVVVPLTTAQVNVNALTPTVPAVINLTVARVTVAALPPTVPAVINLTVAQITVAAPPPTVPAVINLTVAQVTVAALPPKVVIGGYPWQQQSKWRRKLQQQQSLPQPPIIVPLTTAQVNVAAQPFTIASSGNQNLQHRWGPTGPQTMPAPVVPPVAVSVSLPVAQVVVQAYPVTPVTPYVGWQQQSKWRRRTQQQQPKVIYNYILPLYPALVVVQAYPVTPTILDTGGIGVQGLIKVSYTDPSTYVLHHSVAGAVGVDASGNMLSVGYQGPVAAFQPLVSNPSKTETWHALSLTANAPSIGEWCQWLLLQTFSGK